jgi:nucleotide-binding universal stress UspA family protein
LVYALSEGELRGARVEVVGAFARPEYWADQAIPSWSMGPSMEAIQAGAQARIDRIVTEVRDEMGPDRSSRPVVTRVVPGSAAAALLEAASGADLLVVGSRGRGGFASMLLGSVSLQCTLHAPCPVTVVPAPVQSVDQDERTRVSVAAS